MKFTLSDIVALTDARATLAGGSEDPQALSTALDQLVTNVALDTREVLSPDDLFVALKGPHFDGHRFVAQAAAKGVGAALIASLHDLPADYPNALPADFALIEVGDTLRALQTLAAHWRTQFKGPVVAITGSNGKTIVKDMLVSILSREQKVYRSPGSYNSQVGVALSLLGLDLESDVAVIEAGISQAGEMDALREMIQPTMGIVTTIGLAHAAGLFDLDTTAREKRKLFLHCDGPIVVDGHEERLDRRHFLLDRAGSIDGDRETDEAFHMTEKRFHVKRFPVYFADRAENRPPESDADGFLTFVEGIHTHDEGHRFQLRFTGPATRTPSIDVILAIPGAHNIANAAMAAAMARLLDATDAAIQEGLADYVLHEMRLEMHTTGAGVTLINDAYNADPASVKAALLTLQRFGQGQRRIAILGDMLDLGRHSQAAHRQVGESMGAYEVDHLIVVGELARSIAEGARRGGLSDDVITTFEGSPEGFDELHQFLDRFLKSGDVVLLKASRSVGLDRAARRLLESVAPTRLTIDLEAIRHNFHALRKNLGDATKIMAVVKSFGYGNDATRISQTLEREGLDYLAVAYPDEAIPLRQKGLDLPILVTNARAEEADKFAKYDLEALVYTEPVARALQEQAYRAHKTLAVHLEVDTGMHRAGLRPDDVVAMARRIHEDSHLKLKGLMTHFAAADDPAEDAFTGEQIRRFQEVVDALERQGLRPEVIHAANTAASWRFPEARFDMVRVGLGLYGLHPSRAVGDQAPTEAALRFTTRVLHVHELQPGESVGYGRTYRATTPRRLATIAAGYNDGLPRFLSNRGEVLIHGVRCPIVGTVCMDVTVVDVTDLEDVTVGAEVVLFGTQTEGTQHEATLTIDEWARHGETISYELLCNISSRVRRIFQQ